MARPSDLIHQEEESETIHDATVAIDGRGDVWRQ